MVMGLLYFRKETIIAGTLDQTYYREILKDYLYPGALFIFKVDYDYHYNNSDECTFELVKCYSNHALFRKFHHPEIECSFTYWDIYHRIVKAREEEEAYKMHNVFISQPMAGRSKKDILEERRKAIQEIHKNWSPSICVINSYHEAEPDKSSLYLLGSSIQELSQADTAFFLPGWKDARGCQIENECCKMYGIPFVELQA